MTASSSFGGVTVNAYSSPSNLGDYSFWPSTTTTPASFSNTDPIVTVATPNSTDNAVNLTMGSGATDYKVLGGTFLAPSSAYLLSAIDIVTSASFSSPVSLHLYELNSGYTPSDGGYVPSTAFVDQDTVAGGLQADLLGNGNGLAAQIGASVDRIRDFSFTGADRVQLKADTRYAFELWKTEPDNFIDPLYVRRVGSATTEQGVGALPYTQGQIYGSTDVAAQDSASAIARTQVDVGPRNMLMAVYGFVPVAGTPFLQVDINGGTSGQLHPNRAGWSPWGHDSAVNPGNGGQDDVIPGGTTSQTKSFLLQNAYIPNNSPLTGQHTLDATIRSRDILPGTGDDATTQGSTIESRDRGNPPNSGAFTHGDLYRDFAFSRRGDNWNTLNPNRNPSDHRMEIKLENLKPNTPYELTFYAFDYSSPVSAMVFTDVTANDLTFLPSGFTAGTFTPGDGTGGTQYAPPGQMVYGTSNTPTTDSERAVTITATTDANGRLIFHETTLIGGDLGVGTQQQVPVFNGFEIIEGAKSWTGGASGNWSDTTKWADGRKPNGLGQSANFFQNNVTTITVNEPVTLGRMNFSATANYTIGGTSVISLRDSSINSNASFALLAAPSGRTQINVNSGSGNHTISAPLAMWRDTQVSVADAAQTLTLGNLKWDDSFTVANPIHPASMITYNQPGVFITKVGAGTLAVNNLRTTAVAVNGGTLKVIPNGSATGVSKLTNLSIGSGKLDLTNNKLIVTSFANGAGTWTGSTYNGVAGLVKTGMAVNMSGVPQWNGNGIITSETAANGGNLSTTLAVASAGSVGKTSFGGQNVSGTDALVMYTYNGDANFSGNVNADDYFVIDSNYNKSGSVFGFEKGDFNYDGAINADDYQLIDAGYVASQAGPAFSPGAVAGASAVPEPGALALLVASSMALLRRRRRSC